MEQGEAGWGMDFAIFGHYLQCKSFPQGPGLCNIV